MLQFQFSNPNWLATTTEPLPMYAYLYVYKRKYQVDEDGG